MQTAYRGNNFLPLLRQTTVRQLYLHIGSEKRHRLLQLHRDWHLKMCIKPVINGNPILVHSIYEHTFFKTNRQSFHKSIA